MKNITSPILVLLMLLLAVMTPLAQTPWNPAAGIFILQIGDIFPGDSTSATLYYTRFAGTDRVKSVDYYYNGYGFFELRNKRTLASTPGADGILHHPDGDLMVGGQSRWIYKVNKSTGDFIRVTDVEERSNNYHLMMDPDNVTMWSADIPGVLARWSLHDTMPNRIGRGQVVNLRGDDRVISTLAWDQNGTVFYTSSDYRGTGSFGVIDMATLTTRRLFSNLPGAHGMHYDSYSRTIFIFGNSHIIQIDPVSQQILVNLNFANLFSNLTWRFDQGTSDGQGRLFVASNTGYLAFIDFTSNPNRRIDNNVLIHVQWLDPELDDVAPLSGAGSENFRVRISSGTGFSSSSRVFSSSSWAPSSSVISSGITQSSPNISSSSSVGGGVSSQSSSSVGGGGVSSQSSSSVGGGGVSSQSSSSVGGGGVSSQSSSSEGSGGGGTPISSSSEGSGGGGTPISSSSSDQGSGGGGTPLSSSSSDQGSGGGGTPLSSSSSDQGSGGGGTPLSSSSSDQGSGGGGTPLSSSSSDQGSGGGGTPLSSSSSDQGSGGGGTPLSSSSSDQGSGGGGTPLSSSSSGQGSGGGGTPLSSSSVGQGSGGSGIPIPSLRNTNPIYTGFEGVPIVTDTNLFTYPDRDSRGAADSSVTRGTLLVPVPDNTPVGGDVIMVSGNKYRTGSSVGDPITGVGPTTPGEIAPVPTGSLVELVLDAQKLREHFGLQPGDSLRINASPGMVLFNPVTGEGPAQSIMLVLDGNTARIWVSADQPLVDGSLTFISRTGQQLRYGGLEFRDPVPATNAAIIKDSNGDGVRDAVELFLASSLPGGMTVVGAEMVIANQVIPVNSGIVTQGDRIQIPVDAADRALLNQASAGDKILVRYRDERGVIHVREVPLSAMNNSVIRRAVVLRSADGPDSLFVEFNIEISNADLALRDLMVLLNGRSVSATQALLPARSLVLLESGSLVLLGAGADSIQLYPGVTFTALSHIVSEEYDRKVPVTIIDRVPPIVTGSGYYDRDGDGVMDSVVIRFADTLQPHQLEWMYFSIPWYSFRNRVIQLQAQPGELVLHPDDPTMVTWIVRSNTELRNGLTHVPGDLPPAELFVHYPVLDRSFVERRSFTMGDYMPPAIVDARLRYAQDGQDTLVVRFSEAVHAQDANIHSLFLFVHGNDTLPLHPSRIVWNTDRTEATLLLPGNRANRLVAGDKLLANGYSSTPIRDDAGNAVRTTAAPVVVQGSLSHLVESASMGNFSPNDPELREVSAVSLRLVPNSMRARDLYEQGELGHMVELGQRFLPQLVDQAQSAGGSDSLDPAKVLISLSATYFDQIGQHVADTTINLACDHAVFGGNCLDMDRKLFLNWNYKTNDGRFVGTGVYLVQFKLFIRYERTQVMEEVMDKWGVRRRRE